MVTTVWVGVMVVAFFNMRFGWVLTGLVVPGYLVPLIILKPWAAAVIGVEAIITYAVVRTLSDTPSHTRFWSSLFGRDRFFAFVVVSVIVRVVFDAWVWPRVGQFMVAEWSMTLDYRTQLHSLGLVVISLMANQFWKPGLVRGFVTMAISVAVTYAVVRYGLMELTNYNISNLSYMYEDVATSIVAGPKAYIILLTAAFIASRMNLRYGWDFNGILIPALLALQWNQPLKLLTTFFEAGVILFMVHLLLQLRWFANVHIEGARKLVLFFNVGFLYKVILGFALQAWVPGVKVTDYYAFGYLLSTLLAIKMYDKDVFAHMVRTTTQTSLVGAIVGSMIGFGLTVMPSLPTAEPQVAQTVVVERSQDRVSERLRRDLVDIYHASAAGGMPTPLPQELTRFRRAVEDLARTSPSDTQAVEHIAGTMGKLGYELHILRDRYYYLREQRPNRGWGIYIIDTRPGSELTIEVPAPLEERGVAEAGAALMAGLDARALAIAGTRRDANPDRSADALTAVETFFQTFHRALGLDGAVTVRGPGADISGSAPTPPNRPARLWIDQSQPPGLSLSRLKELVGDLSVSWGNPAYDNRQRQTNSGDFADLVLSRETMRTVRARALVAAAEVSSERSRLRIDGYLQNRLLMGKDQLADQGSDLYREPRVGELLFLDEEVLTPLLRLAQRQYRQGGWTQTGLQRLRQLSRLAGAVHYEIIRYRHVTTGRDYLLLSERTVSGQRRYWGTYVIRLGEGRPYVVEIPRPLFELGSFEYGVGLFERMEARALLIAGSHPQANRDGSSDVSHPDNRQSMFNLVNQVILREYERQPALVIQARAFGHDPQRPSPPADVMVSLSDRAGSGQQPELVRDWLDSLQQAGISFRVTDGEDWAAGYDATGTAQAEYLAATRNKHFAVTWLSPGARFSFRRTFEDRQRRAHARALDIPVHRVSLARHVANTPLAMEATVPPGLRHTLDRYVRSQDPVALAAARRQWPSIQYTRLEDLETRQAFLGLRDQRGNLIALLNLAPQHPGERLRVDSTDDVSTQVRALLERRSAWLMFGS